jgi:iron complex outermembrane recepter protein
MTLHILTRSVSLSALILAAASASAQQALPDIDVGAAARPPRVERAEAAPATGAAPGFSAEKKQLPVYREPTGQTFTTVKTENYKTSPLFTIGDLIQYSPGVSIKQGNGPRDVTISIRGSGARVNGALRNIVMLEDGFTVTPTDGYARTDLTDPHAYSGVDVYRGPSSALFGNYANGGAINFRTRTGAEIDGFESGHEFGSFGYVNNYIAIGKKSGDFDVALFASDVRGEQAVLHSQYDTQTINLKASYAPTTTDRFTLKVIHNELYGNVPARLSLGQYYVNPYQKGCWSVGLGANANFCGLTSVFANGVSGKTVAVTAQESGWHRNDRRDVVGLRWEHDLDANTVWRTQFVWDDKDFNQPIDTPVTVGDAPSITASTDVTRHDVIDGHDATHFFGLWYSRARFTTYTSNLEPFGNGALGATTNIQEVFQSNLGAKAREELALTPDVTGVLGLATELSKLSTRSSTINYANNLFTPVIADRAFWNFAPEASLVWRVDSDWTLHARASSGYGTPNYLQLLVNSQGLDGGNTDLKPQRNTGFDAGFDWTPNDRLKVSLTGFHEWYQNELLTQRAAANSRNYTYNAPGSIHRGVEFLVDWRPVDGWRLLGNYSYNNQEFTNFVETRGPNSIFVRNGNYVPGVAAHELTARLGYDQPTGQFKGLGAYVEYTYKSAYFIDNGNQLTIPSYGLVNANVHYDTDLSLGWLKNASAFFEVRNVFDRTYVAAAGVVSNSVNKAGAQDSALALVNSTGSIYAGMPRAFQGGVKFKF